MNSSSCLMSKSISLFQRSCTVLLPRRSDYKALQGGVMQGIVSTAPASRRGAG